MYSNWNLVSIKDNTGFRVKENYLEAESGYTNFYGNVLLIVLHATCCFASGVNTKKHFLSMCNCIAVFCTYY